MNDKKRTDTNSSGPIHLDSVQLEELDKLIESLRKEVTVPAKGKGGKSLASAGTKKA